MDSTLRRRTLFAALFVMLASLLVPAAGATQPAREAQPADCPGLAGTLHRLAGQCPTATELQPDANAAGLGTIAGTVTEAGSGTPLEAITAFFTDAATLDSAGEVETGPDGTYSIELPPGDYHILFAEETGDHVALMWDDTLNHADSTPVTVIADQTTTVDKVMGTNGGTISGMVTDFDANPVEGDFVLAVAEHPGWDLLNIAKASLGVAETAADGSYTIRGLPTGDYWVIFVSIASFAWYGSDTYTDDPIADGATLVPVTAPANTGGIDGSLEYGNGGLLLGTLEDGFGPVEGICVDAVPTANLTTTVASAVTDADGNYTLAGLADTPFYLRYQDCTRGVYVTTWYPDITTDQPTGADVFTLSESDLQVIFDLIDLRLTDVDASIFRPDIIWLAGEGITKGCNTAQTLFCPNQPGHPWPDGRLPGPRPQPHRPRPQHRLHRRQHLRLRKRHREARHRRHHQRLQHPANTLFCPNQPRHPWPDGRLPGPRPQPHRPRPQHRLHRRQHLRLRKRHREARHRRHHHRLQSHRQHPVLPRPTRHPRPDGRLPPTCPGRLSEPVHRADR